MRQSMHMTSEANVLNWPLTSGGSSIQLVWRNPGPVAWSGFAASFPAAPKEPGVYLIKVTLDDRYRIYIGEAEDLNGRLRRYGGRADEKPNQRGMTTTNMRGRPVGTALITGADRGILSLMVLRPSSGRGPAAPDAVSEPATAPARSFVPANRVITRCVTRSTSVPGATIPAMPGDLQRLPRPVSAAAPGLGPVVLAGELLGWVRAEPPVVGAPATPTLRMWWLGWLAGEGPARWRPAGARGPVIRPA